MCDPLLQFTLDEIQEMSRDAFAKLLEQSNEYVHNKYSMLNESKISMPHFSSEEELMSYYHAISLEDANKKITRCLRNEYQ